MGNAKNAEEAIIMTREGYEKLKNELIRLRSEGRMEIGRQLEEARGFGDLSENAEYHAAKEAQAKMESRILWLEAQLGKAKVVDSKDLDTSRVSLGTTVEVFDLETQKAFTYTIVGSEESDPAQMRISSASPVGQALLGAEVGNEVLVRAPKGVRKLRITRISVA
ncbi:MAG: transcription elongation factor GreA [Synergistaceae bacterium]|jgi:transcription elongation factor GreA|nr:transcription elongation factor GreA [Synergistaceae bacterium]